MRRYINDVPNNTFCTDGEITRVGFMVRDDVRAYINNLERHGFIFAVDGNLIDIAVVDMHQGFTAKCDWLDVMKTTHFLGTDEYCTWCRLAGSDSTSIALPEGWKFETSLTKTHTLTPIGDFDKNHKFLKKNENGSEVFLNLKSGEEIYTGRTN